MGSRRKNADPTPADHLVNFVKGDGSEVMKRLAQNRQKFALCFADHSHAYEDVLSCCQLLGKIVLDGGFVVFHDYVDHRNVRPRNGRRRLDEYGVCAGVADGLPVQGFEFFGCYGCCGVFQRRCTGDA